MITFNRFLDYMDGSKLDIIKDAIQEQVKLYERFHNGYPDYGYHYNISELNQMLLAVEEYLKVN